METLQMMSSECKPYVWQIWWSCIRPRNAMNDWMGRFVCWGIEFAHWTQRGGLFLNWQE